MEESPPQCQSQEGSQYKLRPPSSYRRTPDETGSEEEIREQGSEKVRDEKTERYQSTTRMENPTSKPVPSPSSRRKHK